MLARRERALESRHRRCLRAHALGYVGLRQAGVSPGSQHHVEQCEFFAVQSLVFGVHLGVRQGTRSDVRFVEASLRLPWIAIRKEASDGHRAI